MKKRMSLVTTGANRSLQHGRSSMCYNLPPSLHALMIAFHTRLLIARAVVKAVPYS